MPGKKGRQGGGAAAKGGKKSPPLSDSKATSPSNISFLDQDCTLVVLTYPSIAALNLALGRLSCFAESKQHKGKYIPLDQWLQMPKGGGLVYEGHNFPFSVALQWLLLAPETDLDHAEKLLFDGLLQRKLLRKDRKGRWECKLKYLIAGVEGDTETFRHEVMHALYFGDPEYRSLVSTIFSEDIPAPMLKFVKTYMNSKGYTPDVMEDEFQAYLCCDDADIVGGKKNMATKHVGAIQQKLRAYQKNQVVWQEEWTALMLNGTMAI